MNTIFPDRTKAPIIKELSHFDLIKANKHTLANGMHVHTLHAGNTDVVRIDFVFHAGNTAEHIPGVSVLTAKMLQEGTGKFTAKQIADTMALKGAFMEITSSADNLTISATCLYTFLREVIELICQIIDDSVFPPENFSTVKDIAAQQWKINMEKTSFVASGLIRKQLFGELHPYGLFLTWEQLQAIENKNCINFYKNNIKNAMPEVFVAGGKGYDLLSPVEKFFGKKKLFEREKHISLPEALPLLQPALMVERKNSVQSSIRLGKRLFTRKHPDYIPFKVLNEILGGYFGSRLMKNIREEKGLTYGVHSQVVQLRHAGYFLIGTDVNKENTKMALDEIRHEIQTLRKEPVPKEELDTVKNYMIGSYLGSISHAMSLMDKYKMLYFSGLTYDYFDTYIENIRKTTSEQIIEMAQKYLDPQTLIEVVVGGK